MPEQEMRAWDSLASTVSKGSLMSSARCEISTREKGSISRSRFPSSSVSYSAYRTAFVVGISTLKTHRPTLYMHHKRRHLSAAQCGSTQV